MSVSAEEVKKLRQQTGAGIMDCKQALEASQNNKDKALSWLKKRGLSVVAKKSGREASEGLISSYIHGEGKMGVLLEVNTETDFSARNESFKKFVRELSLHILAMNPLYIAESNIPEETKQEEKKIFAEQALNKTKNKEILPRITEGLYQKWLTEVCLLKQEFVREEAKNKQTVEEALNDLISRIGENILIRRFVRFELGELSQKNKD